MTMTGLAAAPAPGTLRGMRAPDVLVVGGSLLAPLNLLIVRSLTVYDVLIGIALLILWRRGLLQAPSKRYLAVSYIFLLTALLSAFRATYASEALTQVLQYMFVFFVEIPAVLTVVRTRRMALTSIFLLCVGTVGAILFAFVTQPTQGAGRVLVFYSENPNRLGYPAAYLLPFLIVLWHSTRGSSFLVRALADVACFGSGYLAVWALFASASRSSLLGSIVALLVFVVLRPGHELSRMMSRGLVLGAVIGLVGFGLVATGQLPTTLEDRVTRSLNHDAEDQAGLVGDREHLVTAAMRAFVASPFLGSGLDNFRYVTTDYDSFATPQLPHNLWLQLLVQVGAFGTIAFGLFILFWFQDLTRAFRRADPPDGDLLWGLVAALCGVLTIFMFAPEMLDRHYWLIVALGLAAAEGVLRHRVHAGGS